MANQNGRGSSWSTEELLKLRTDYPTMFKEELELHFPGRTYTGIRAFASKLGIRPVSRVVRYPRAYNNDTDGGYVSGLVDGEGWFTIGVSKKNNEFAGYAPMFGLSLRNDDAEIVRWLSKYFGCGSTRFVKSKNSAPSCVFTSSKIYDAASSIIPHFDKYPLRAKKKKNFEIWKSAVRIIQSTRCHRWTAQMQSEVEALRESMLALRNYGELV